MKTSHVLALMAALTFLFLPACHSHEEKSEDLEHQVVVTVPKIKDIILTQRYVCQIHSQVHINVKALKTDGYIGAIPIKEGQEVKQGDVMFQIVPTLYKAKLEAEVAEVQLADLEYKNTERLSKEKPPVVSQVEVALYAAKLARAKAKLQLAQAEYSFCTIKAPFDGIVDRLYEQTGSLIKEGDVLTTLSDNSVMWVYFNVPEKQYYEYMASSEQEKADQKIELQLANGAIFPQAATSVRIEAKFNNENGNIKFRADFPNPHRLLRHGMTGNILIHRTLKNAMVIPQRATFEILAKRFVFVVDKEDKARQREIVVQHEQEDIFVVGSGLRADEKFIFEGGRQVRDGDKLEFEFRPPDEILGHQKSPAE